MRIRGYFSGVNGRVSVWLDDPAVQLERFMSMASGAWVNVLRLPCSVLVGTHVDAPIDFVEDGVSVKELSLEALIGPYGFGYIQKVIAISPATVEGVNIPMGTRRLVLRIRNSELWSRPGGTFGVWGPLRRESLLNPPARHSLDRSRLPVSSALRRS